MRDGYRVVIDSYSSLQVKWSVLKRSSRDDSAYDEIGSGYAGSSVAAAQSAEACIQTYSDYSALAPFILGVKANLDTLEIQIRKLYELNKHSKLASLIMWICDLRKALSEI